MIVDSLQCRQASDGRCAGVKQIKPFWHWRDMLRVDGHILGVKSALRIDEFVGPNAFGQFETRRPRSFLRDKSSTIGSKNERKFRSFFRPPATANIRIPNSDARSMQRDQHFARTGLRNWKR